MTQQHLNAEHQAIAEAAAHAVVDEFFQRDSFRTAVQEAVDTALSNRLGLDPTKPELLKRDMQQLRSLTETLALIKAKGIGASVNAIVSFFFAAFGLGVAYMILNRH